MTQPSAATVYHDTNLPHLVDTHFTRRWLIKDLLHHLNLSIMVTRSKRTHLQSHPPPPQCLHTALALLPLLAQVNEAPLHHWILCSEDSWKSCIADMQVDHCYCTI